MQVEGVHCLFSPDDLIKAEAICKADAQVCIKNEQV